MKKRTTLFILSIFFYLGSGLFIVTKEYNYLKISEQQLYYYIFAISFFMIAVYFFMKFIMTLKKNKKNN